jgi:hypothetical protein
MQKKQQNVRAFSICEIAQWQTELQEKLTAQDEEKELIVLPTLQRGFVWKPYQMEALWDSILRGYPIGALLMSATQNRKDLLDGQQRCTTIVLGFKNPFAETESVLNINAKNIPSIWIDLKPLGKNKYGLNFGVRVLTRSHPWGYQLTDHRKTISAQHRENALKYLRDRVKNNDISFSEVDIQFRTPWDAHFPIPLYMLFQPKTDNYEDWHNELLDLIKSKLKGIKTIHGDVNYENVDETWLKAMHKGVDAAKSLLIPEIMISKDLMIYDEEKFDREEEATLFHRINTDGTRISMQEMKYSILKAMFPEAKELVERIDLKYISPSNVVNLFIRLILIRQSDYSSFQREVPLTRFRELLKDENFKNELITLIKDREAKELVERANMIISSHFKSLPQIFYREMISNSTELLLVLFAYLSKNATVEEMERVAIRNSFMHFFLFSEKKNQDKVATALFNKLKEGKFRNWKACMEEVIEKHDEILPLLKPEYFTKVLLENVMPTYLEERKRHFNDRLFIEQLIRKNDEIIPYLLDRQIDEEITEEDAKNIKISLAAIYWTDFVQRLLWNRNIPMIAQNEYFNREFKDYMEFEGIQDTNRPWDWDHIYPISWVKGKKHISHLVKWVSNSNGNIRALSFNENRSQSNHESPKIRFENNLKAQNDSFVKENDLEHWLQLSNNDIRLKEEVHKEKIDHFVKATFKRISNIYSACYQIITEDSTKSN